MEDARLPRSGSCFSASLKLFSPDEGPESSSPLDGGSEASSSMATSSLLLAHSLLWSRCGLHCTGGGAATSDRNAASSFRWVEALLSPASSESPLSTPSRPWLVCCHSTGGGAASSERKAWSPSVSKRLLRVGNDCGLSKLS